MKLYNPPRYQWIGFMVSMPFICWALNYIMYGNRLYTDWRILVISFPIIWAFGIVSWYSHFQYDTMIRRHYPNINQSGKRMLFIALVFLLIMTPSVLLIFYTYHQFHILGYQIQAGDLVLGLVVGFIVNVIFETLWEGMYMVGRYKETLAEKEMLERMRVDQEFENLKSQVNPHFLFNCFNTLSSLITENRDEAEKFLDELSKVYRYLLRSNEDGFATLASELNFIESYFTLLKTRHGGALSWQLEIDKQYLQYLLPSLSLQLLVENAVKHNVVSKTQPLKIDIFTTPGKQLVVNNTLQPKLKKESSTRIGLNNIQSKYKLIHETGFQVVESDRNFMVVLPLIWNTAMQSPAKNASKLKTNIS